MKKTYLQATDPEIATTINKELQRQQQSLNLIASENYTHPAILEATGSIMTNKYAEGYPGKRYYGGCQFVDQAEQLAIDRCKRLFGAEHANVQSHAGSQANMAAYLALINPGDTLLGMSLSEGGHLTHGHPVNFSGRLFKIISYGVHRDTQQLDYQEIERLAYLHKPKLIICGASAYPRTINFERLAQIARAVNAYLIADIAHIAGLVATGHHPTPVGHADVITSTTHKTLRGPRGAFIMSNALHATAIDKMVMPGIQGGPCMHTIAAKAVCFQLALEKTFHEYSAQIIANAQAMAQSFMERGYTLVSGGTDNHLMLIDLRSKNITGKEAEELLAHAHIYVNRNTIPFDPQKPFIASGIRIGTPAITTRGMKEKESKEIVELIDALIQQQRKTATLAHVQERVKKLCDEFPIYTK